MDIYTNHKSEKKFDPDPHEPNAHTLEAQEITNLPIFRHFHQEFVYFDGNLDSYNVIIGHWGPRFRNDTRNYPQKFNTAKIQDGVQILNCSKT